MQFYVSEHPVHYILYCGTVYQPLGVFNEMIAQSLLNVMQRNAPETH